MWPGLEQAYARGPEERDPGEGATCPSPPCWALGFPQGSCLPETRPKGGG